jgi:hypothetical protein
VALALFFYAVFIARSAFVMDGAVGFTLFDDGMISMRYARNLAEGHGLVWNAGQEAVEGFSNPLWTLWMAAIHLMGISDWHASLVVMLTGAVLLIAAAAVSARLAERLFPSPGVGAVAFLFVGFNYALVFWTLRGMEVGLLALLMSIAVRLTFELERRASVRVLLGLCTVLMLAELTRRDAAIIHVVVMAYLAWRLDGARRRLALGALAIALVVALGSQAVLSAWYYGDPWPNTAALKLGGVSLIDRLRRGGPALLVVGLRHVLPFVIAAACLLPRVIREPALRGPGALLSALVAAQCAYSAWVGGDAWEYMGYANRYIAVAVPPLAILAAAGITELASAGSRLRYRVAALLVALVGARVAVEVILIKANRGIPRGVEFLEVHTGQVSLAGGLVTVACGLIAIALWLGSSRRGASVAAARTGRAGFASAASPRLVVSIACALYAIGNGPALAGWALFNASALEQDNRWARTGMAVRRITNPDTVLAVTSAGNFPYFARRPALDILGKSDRVIARSSPVSAFVPGHNKWNLDYTIRRGRPDLACGLPRTAGDVRYLRDLGYDAWPGTCFALRGSTRLRPEALRPEFQALFPDVPPLREAGR